MNFDHILHRADGTLVELNSQVGTFRAVTSEKLTAVRQDVSSAELTLVSSEAFTVNVGDWIQAKGMRLYCMSTIDRYTCSEDNNREYQLTFYDPIYYLRQAIFYNTFEVEAEGAYSYSRVDNTYPSVGTFEDFVKLCCYNCNSVQGERLFKVGAINEDIAPDIRVLTFSDYNCLAVLKQTCEDFETTWQVRINEDPEPDSVFIIDFGVEIEDFPVTLKVEHAQGLTSIDVTASDKDVYTQFVIKGGTENLPSDYPYPNLQLDEDSESTPPILANSMIKLPDLYSRWGKSIKELTYDDIKPSRTGTVTSTSENILKFTDSDLIGAAWSPVGGTIHFVSGHLIGFTFNCQDFNSTTGEITIESTEENNGFVLPSPTDSYYRINELDKYNIAGVSLPTSYITDAKALLKERALLGIDYWSQPRMQYAITIDPKIISVEIIPNMGFHIVHPALGIDKIIRAQQVIYDLSKDSPYDIEDIIISDLKNDDSKADTTHRQIATTRSIVNGTGASNVYEAKMISRQRLLDDYAKSQNLPNWSAFMDILNSGKGLWQDDDGEWWLNVNAIKAGTITADMINVTGLIADEVFVGGIEGISDGEVSDAMDVFASNLGYAANVEHSTDSAYEELQYQAANSGTIIVGGYLRTALIEAGTIVANHIAALTITADKIANATITGGKIALTTITAANIYGGTITATEIANSTITGAKIASGTIEATNIKDSTITGGKIALATIEAANIKDATITGGKIALVTIEASNIKDATITGGKIAGTTITAANIANSTITGGKIASSTITAANIYGGTITATEIANATITGSKIASATITGSKIASATITAANIYGGTITATEIADSTITGAKIATSTITATNIYGGTITATEIANSTITGGKIALATIDAANIKDATITGGKIALTTITAANIYGGTITATEIANSTITGAKIASGTIESTNIKDSTITGGKIANTTITNANIVDSTIKAAKIDVADLIAASAFIDNLTVKKLTTATDADGTSVSVSASASGGKAGVVLSGPSSNGAKISYTGGAAVVSVYDATNTLQMAEGYFIAARSGMSASIGVSSLGAELSVTSNSYSAHLKSTDLYVGGLPSTSQTSGHFWRDSNGIVRCGAQGLNFVIGTGSDTSTIYFSTT